MQNHSSFQPIPPSFSEQEHLKCPRCDSNNTKFCYYNNYNLSQPRHFCKNCRRYWTKGGALRNIPIGGGTRKTTKRSSNLKRPSSSSPPSSSETSSSAQTPRISPKPEQIDQSIGTGLVDQDRQLLDITGSFSSLLASNGQFGNLFQGLSATCSPDLPTLQFGDFTEHSNSSSIENPTTLDLQNTNHHERDTFLRIQGAGDSSCWENGNGNGWPDLAIYTPGSSFE